MKKIVIGTSGKGLTSKEAYNLKSILESKDYECEVVVIESTNNLMSLPETAYGSVFQDAEDALLKGNIDIAISPLNELSTKQPDGLVIGALSERKNPQYLLLLSPDAVDNNQLLKMKKNSNINCSVFNVQAQLLSLRSDLSISNNADTVDALWDLLRNNEINGIVITAVEKEEISERMNGYHEVKLHPHEFIPCPGQGVNAYRCLQENIEVRKILKEVHHQEVGSCTNVERKLLRRFSTNDQPFIGVYCNRDIAGNYHAYASYAKYKNQAPIFVKVSQNTTFGLDQKIHQLIQEKLN